MQFYHIRYHDKHDTLVARGGYTFALLSHPEKKEMINSMTKNGKPHPKITQFLTVLGDGDKFIWGVSKCNFVDTFSKRTGRQKALGRCISEKFCFYSPVLTDEQTLLFTKNISRLMFASKSSMPDKPLVDQALKLTDQKELVFHGNPNFNFA